MARNRLLTCSSGVKKEAILALDLIRVRFRTGNVFGSQSAIRPDSLQRAGALGLLHRLLAMDVVDAEGLDDGAEGEHKTRGNGR